jgi:hypothetical protein
VVVAAAEEIRLAELAIALGAVAVLDRAVDGAEQLGASRGQADAGRDETVARARLHQRFEHLLVDDAEIELFAELMDRRDRAGPFADLDDRVNRAFAEAFDRRQSEPHPFGHDGEMQLALIDVRRQHGDAALA